MIYELLTSKGKLSSAHKQELIINRGFPEAVVDELRFFSGGKYILGFEKDFTSVFNEDELLASGVFIKPEKSGQLTFSSQLLDDRIIIPYLNKEGKAYYVRPHKMGLEVPIQIYHEKISDNTSPHAILTESEFKAVAGTIWGFKTIGIPGIASFSDTHFTRLVKFIQSHGIKNICILFDNEIKDNPDFPNYKDDPFKRFDTEYFAYLMAKDLSREGFDCRIGHLPDSWRINGKIDLDGALAQKRTADDIKAVIAESKNFKAYLKELPADTQDIISRKLAKKHLRNQIVKDFGKYHAIRKIGKSEYQEEISNFTIKVIARHETADGVVREIVLVNEFGKHSQSFALPSEPMVKRDSFANFVMNKGNYVWTGNNHDLAVIWQGLFLEDDGRHIIEPDHIGWISDEKIFMFGNMAFKEDGEAIIPDNHSIFWRDKYGLKPVSISVSGGRNAINEGIPIVSNKPVDFLKIREQLVNTLGKYEAYIVLGWAASVIFMEDVFAAYNSFPFLFLSGRRGSGKSTIAKWAMNFFGIETEGLQAEDSTPVAIQRLLGYYSSLPVWVDDYRNTKKVQTKDGLFRNVYNRQSAGKGVRAAFGVRQGKIRGTLLFTGEETPNDNALLTRCVVVNVLQRNRKEDNFKWFQNHRFGMSYLSYYLLANKAQLLKDFKENIAAGKDIFVERGLDDRMALNYSIIGSGYCALFGELPKDFQDYLADESQRVKQEYDKEHAMQVFWEDLLALQSTGKIRETMWASDEDKIYIYFHGLYTIWASEYRSTHGNEPFKAGAIRKYMEEEDGFESIDQVKKIGKHARRCVVFDKKTAPRELTELTQELSASSVL